MKLSRAKWSVLAALMCTVLACIVAFHCSELGFKKPIPLAEHPRPDFMREAWINLNGSWDFSLDSLDAGESAQWQDGKWKSFQTITVPFSWAAPLSGIGVKNVHIAWYARDIRVPRDGVWTDRRVFLVIGACDFATTVWLNSKPVGKHEGGYTPFEFDLTDLLEKGKSNRLVVRVEDKPVQGRQTGKQGYGDAKGMWQTVYLEGRSQIHIRQVHFNPDIDRQNVAVSLKLSGSSKTILDFSVSFKDTSVKAARQTIPAGQESLVFVLPVSNPRLWTLEDPYLYDVNLTLGEGEKEMDRVSSYFGMRQIGTVQLPGSNNRYIALNHKPVYLKMTLDQSFHPEGFYTFPSDAFMKEEILRAKQIGLNSLRIHIKTEIPRKLYWADKLGLLIMQDVPNFRGNPDEHARKNWEYTAQRQIARDYNHPSIFSWILFNESWGLITSAEPRKRVYLPETQKWVKSCYVQAKQADPTRLVEDNSACLFDHVATDINSWHMYIPGRVWSPVLDWVVKSTYPGSAWNFIGGRRQTDVPMINSECGAVWGYQHATGDIDITYEYHIMTNEFRRRPKIAGFIFTEFHDVINEWNGYYRYDRSIKDFGLDELCPGMTINDFHSDAYLIPGDDFWKVVRPGAAFDMPLTLSSLSERVPEKMLVKTRIHGWNRYGEHKEYAADQFTFQPKPWSVQELPPARVKAPDEECLAIFCTELIDDQGRVVNRNFVPFRVLMDGSARTETLTEKSKVIRLAPAQYAKGEWSVKQVTIPNGQKVWGTGTGFFEYAFPWPEKLGPEQVAGVEFLAELSSRKIQNKDMTQEPPSGRNTGKGPDFGPNSYPQTDRTRHPSRVTVTLNDADPRQIVLENDPADHRGLLSWMNQKPGDVPDLKPGDVPDLSWLFERKPWRLEEPGSYGYLVKIPFGAKAIEKAGREGVLRIRLAVGESSSTSGGLAVYGEDFGRYPFGPTVIVHMK